MHAELFSCCSSAAVLGTCRSPMFVRFCSSKKKLKRPRTAPGPPCHVQLGGQADGPARWRSAWALGVACRPCRVCGSSRSTLACLGARETYCLAVLIAMMDLPFSLHSGCRRELYGALQCTGRRNRVGEPLLGVQEDSLGCLVVLKSQF